MDILLLFVAKIVNLVETSKFFFFINKKLLQILLVYKRDFFIKKIF